MIRLIGSAAVDTDAEVYGDAGEGSIFDPDSAAFAIGLAVMVGVLVAIHLGVGPGRHSI